MGFSNLYSLRMIIYMNNKRNTSPVNLYLVMLVLFGYASLLFLLELVCAHRVFYYLLTLLFDLIIIGIVLYRRQGLEMIGLKKNATPAIIIVILSIIIVLYAFYSERKNLFGIWIYYLFIVSFSEELLFRGFAHIKIYTILKSNRKTILILGSIYGMFHGFDGLMYQEQPLIHMLNQIGGGILGHAFFYYIYYKTNNILYPTIVHAIMDWLPSLLKL